MGGGVVLQNTEFADATSAETWILTVSINKGRVRWLAKGDALGQAHFVATLFDIAA